MSRKKVTMQQIADRLGISKVSVSKALNNQPGGGRELRDEIYRIGRDLGYDRRSRVPEEERPQQLGLLVSDRCFFENEQFYTKIHFFLLQECTRRKIGLYLQVLDSTRGAKSDLSAFLGEHDFGGLFLTGWLDDRALRLLIADPTPKVVIDSYKVNMPVDAIVIDNYYASFMATSCLIERTVTGASDSSGTSTAPPASATASTATSRPWIRTGWSTARCGTSP